MDEEYDVIVLGTGLKECILSGLLSVDGLKVLHMDRNDYYGGESTSLNLIQLWKRFRGNDKPPAHLGSSRDYNVDMIPKFMMANGTLVRVLIHTDVTKYLYFKAVDGSFVYNKGKIHKVPATDMEALKSPLMGIFEKRRARKFFIYVQDYDEKDPKTHDGMDLTRVTTRELIAKYGLDDNTVDFIGHALALQRDDRYLNEPALDTVKRMKLYAESLARFQGGSPYIYPLYGLGELPQAFARLSAVYGGTYMLNKPECKVEFNEEGKVVGVTSEGETAKCKKVVCDPSYLQNKVRKVGKVARAIAIMSHPIPNTNDSHSVQVILPQKQLGRQSDMYLFCCSYSHNVAPKGKFIAFVSTDAETDNPESELKPGIDLLGPVDEIFFDIYDRYEPVNEPTLDNCFISTSYDATTHFESTVVDVLNMYTLITGKVLDLSVDLSAATANLLFKAKTLTGTGTGGGVGVGHLQFLCSSPHHLPWLPRLLAFQHHRNHDAITGSTSTRPPPRMPLRRPFSSSSTESPELSSSSSSSSSSFSIKDAADMLDIRVGRILKAWRHEEADSLYVEEVDVGEAEPRIICSGLVNYIPLHHLQDIKVVVLANLKPRNMRGVKSSGMLMAASDASHDNVELLLPPQDSIPGERIWFGSQLNQENQTLPSPATPNQIQKKKVWELVQPHLKTNDSCIVILGDHVMQTSAGAVLCRSLKNANVS
ncbi:hypothetical protein G4B88_013324 [Cannabis sativa]|uniref:tRNA-binding domain-containing protein n=1 Tax=Cannabis sativa TaxID=3483 RepID=A0A7J6E260_CANSA|nr:hypothetical protein G4B88_013324 [Cannabis sativa]